MNQPEPQPEFRCIFCGKIIEFPSPEDPMLWRIEDGGYAHEDCIPKEVLEKMSQPQPK